MPSPARLLGDSSVLRLASALQSSRSIQRRVAARTQHQQGVSDEKELLYLVYVAVLTMLLWVPYTLARIAKWDLVGAVGYRQNPPPHSPWAVRISGRAPCTSAYTFAIPWVRTLAFAVGFFAQAVIAWQIVAR